MWDLWEFPGPASSRLEGNTRSYNIRFGDFLFLLDPGPGFGLLAKARPGGFFCRPALPYRHRDGNSGAGAEQPASQFSGRQTSQTIRAAHPPVQQTTTPVSLANPSWAYPGFSGSSARKAPISGRGPLRFWRLCHWCTAITAPCHALLAYMTCVMCVANRTFANRSTKVTVSVASTPSTDP